MSLRTPWPPWTPPARRASRTCRWTSSWAGRARRRSDGPRHSSSFGGWRPITSACTCSRWTAARCSRTARAGARWRCPTTWWRTCIAAPSTRWPRRDCAATRSRTSRARVASRGTTPSTGMTRPSWASACPRTATGAAGAGGTATPTRATAARSRRAERTRRARASGH